MKLVDLQKQLDPCLSSEEISNANTDVFRCAFGICLQDEPEIINRLRILYWRGFMSGLGHIHQSGSPAGITIH